MRPAAVVAVPPAALLPEVALVVPLPQLLSRLLREAQLLRPELPLVVAVLPVLLPEVAALVVWVQGLVASEILRRR